MKKQIICVAVPGPFMEGLDYQCVDDVPAVGCRVKVPLRNREVVGIVLKHVPDDTKRSLKAIIETVDHQPLFNSVMMTFVQWLSDYYHHPIGDCYATVMPKQLCQGKPFEAKERSKQKQQAAVSSPALELTLEQKTVIEKLSPVLDHFGVSLLEGVTGSGKTEVYLQLVDRVLAEGRQVLVLVPEIGLTPQTFVRFQKRFGEGVVALHSGLNESQKTTAWYQLANGEARVLVGTRSALFAPFKDLGIIIVDEEHDLSFKQQSLLRYHARDAAIKRAQLLNIPCLLGSATPSIESLHHALTRKYQHFRLSSRPGKAVMPSYHLIDMRGKKMTGGLSDPLIEQIRKHLATGSQVLIFVNRRGYAPVLMCHECGFIAQCTRCDCALTLHRQPVHLCCHHCGRTSSVPKICPECEQLESLTDVGAGTEKIEAHLQALFPKEPVVRIDRGSTMRKGELDHLLEQIHSGEARLLVGTQMLAKGHHFEKVTLVGVVNIDDGLASADFRSIERVGQLLTQVSGRAGRAGAVGDVFIQTHQPDNPQLKLLLQSGYHAFANELIAERQTAAWPPYSYLALIHSEAKSQQESRQFLEHCLSHFQAMGLPEVMLLGPVPALLQKKAGFYRYQLLLQSAKRSDLHRAVATLKRRLDPKLANRVRWGIDIDPLELL